MGAHRDTSTHLHRLGVRVAKHPVAVIITWLVLAAFSLALALGTVTGHALFDDLSSGEITAPGEAREARDLLVEAGGGDFAADTLIVEGSPATSPFVRQQVARAVERIHETEGVARVINPLVLEEGVEDPRAGPLVQEQDDGRYGFVTVVEYEEDLEGEALEEAQRAVDVQLDEIVSGSRATDSKRGSVQMLVDEIVEQVSTDLKFGEGIALPITFVAMVLIFGGFLAAGIPLLGALASIAGALATLWGFAHVIELDATVVNIVTVLGLGLCIDYGLLIVSRFREEISLDLDGGDLPARGRDVIEQATGRTLDRAGRTVVFSAVTVAVAMSGLFFFPATFMRASGAAGVSVVALCLAVATTLVPALCALGARRLVRGRTERGRDDGVFARLAGRVQRAPWLVIALVLAALVAMALPATRMEVTSSGTELLPVGSDQRTFFAQLAEDYPELATPDVQVVTTADESQVRAWARDEAAALPHVDSVEVSEVGTTPADETVLTVDLRTDDEPLGDDSRALAAHLRSDGPPFAAHVGGQASGLADFVDALVDRAPWAAATVVLATFVLLFLMTGSVVVPIKALIMNVVSLGASLGVLVWVFQDGHLSGLLDFASVGALEVSIPVLVLAFAFGLSMDYEVFLLSRIVELHEQGRPTDEAVRLGLQRSGRIITSAALLMVIVFSGFILAQILAVKQTGVALVVAIIIDATLVRMLLVPATMSVLGEWNWWAPRWMKRLHARVGITE
ncbi:MMPL family transporter [Janibacter cremeus]|uniref:MMPL family transporter n=1 Tax=Janibacter cremeus TaxID=1285192 RepID=UPI0023F9A6A8|nr:MMPL family transporter [Janibacter cremeus]WEV79276.1 MMPL family transporter [Janibacter cremeus]